MNSCTGATKMVSPMAANSDNLPLPRSPQLRKT
jgi:hypothetical protein